MRSTNMICAALNDFQNEKQSQNNYFVLSDLLKNVARGPWIWAARPHLFFEFETPELDGTSYFGGDVEKPRAYDADPIAGWAKYGPRAKSGRLHASKSFCLARCVIF